MKDFSYRLLDRSKPVRVHLIGVAGSGMSGLALLLLGMGHRVSGCDRVTSGETQRMQTLGLEFHSPHTAESVQDADVVVYSSAIRAENVALAEARRLGVSCIRRAECLAAILHAKKGVVVSGTHGKTTTSAMCAHVLRRGSTHPSHYVGAEIPILGANAHWDEKGELMVAEGDESDGTLALYKPAYSIVLNVEAEHLDFYRDLDHVKEVFQTLLDQTSQKIIYCASDEETRTLCENQDRAISYGWDAADYTASDLAEGRGVTTFTVLKAGKPLGRIELGIPGRHNVLNALAAIALADDVGVPFAMIANAMSSFAGARRRFETKYLSNHLRIIDDYGHHPTEVAATLQTARSLQPNRLVVLFQPHRYSRTQLLADDFGKSFQGADVVYVTDVYAASEQAIEGVSGQTIVDAIERHGDTKAVSVPTLKSAHYVVGNQLEEGDLFLTLGAGNVHEAGAKIARDQTVVTELKQFTGSEDCSVSLYEPMRRHCTMLVGGPAQFWSEPKTFEAFAKVVEFSYARGLPVRVLGRGSNLLIRDGGIRGFVIHPKGGEFNEVKVEGETITAGAGVRFKKLASMAQAAGIGGFEWMEGIPGNVGGGLRMNAGAMGVETFDQVLSVTVLDEAGEIVTKSKDEIPYYYRHVPSLQAQFVLKACFKGHFASSEEIKNKLEASRQKRRTSQPIAASAGCIFKNPESTGAGKLIDEMGLKGSAVGKAEVSLEHGNFIVNRGKATASEVLSLIEKIKESSQVHRGVTLETEVQIIGEDEITF